jgi:hypothetical protein
MSRIRVGILIGALVSVVIAVASVAFSPASAQTTSCVLSPQQQQPCTNDGACRSFGAICNSVTMFCVCPMAPTPTCFLVTGQIVPCVTDAECVPFGAVCGPSGSCACLLPADAGGLLDAATPDAFSPPVRDAGATSASVAPQPVGSREGGPITSGCSYVGR